MGKEPDPDAQLVRRVQKGDLRAFEELVERYKQPLANFIYRIVGDATEAEDLAQQAFVQMYGAIRQFEPRARFSTWLFVIARNLCLNELRRRQRHPAESLEPLMHGEEGDQDRTVARGVEDRQMRRPDERVLSGELWEKAQQAINQLPENQRTALMLWIETDLSYEQIAEVLQCSLSAVKSLIHRARETLRQRLKPYLQSGEWLDRS